MASKLLNLVALSSLAILACSFGSVPVAALSVDNSVHARALGHHNLIAKKKRADTRRCKPRPSSLSSSAASGATPAPSTPAAPAPAPPAPPAPAPPTGGGTAGGGKVGLAWANGDNPSSLRTFVTGKTSAIYSWSAWKPAGSDEAGLHFVPMLWGNGADKIQDFYQNVKPGFADTILGFNEPNLGSQANMSPGDAVAAWWQHLEPKVAEGYRLISPAVTSGPDGIVWLQNFMNACGGCHVGAIAVHWYGTNPQEFISYVTKFHDTFGLNIWVTEFACEDFTGGPQCSRDQVFSFLQTTTDWMDNTPWVEKYFYFGLMPNPPVNQLNALMGGDLRPNDLGWTYIS